MPHPLPGFDQECFFIAPIGADGSEIRDRSDGVLDFIVLPAAEEVGLSPVRADRIAKPGQITRQILDHILEARAVVADLTGANANVYYELGIRHDRQLPVVLIAEDTEDGRLPFDIAGMRTIFFQSNNLRSASKCKDEIVKQLKEALGGQSIRRSRPP